MDRLAGKVAVITGGSSGIGLATAQRFVQEGAYVFITGRRQAELDKAKALIARNVTAVQGDASDLSDIDRLYKTVKSEKGHIDVVFANAGGAEFSAFETVTEENFDKTFDLNVRGTYFTVQKALPLMKDGGSIILTGSIAGVKGMPSLSVYSASKAAVRSFARSWAMELKDRKIRANVISPGPIKTPIIAGLPKDVMDQIISTVPLGRMGKPEEIASVAAFLASDDASFITGIELYADGGAAQV